ncbi:response regulator transcription factor [Dyella humi]|uniref:Response regulator transcription factor n=1 Tax=Dyella humi TaxID=1770547 RepID=A0ABW8IFT6_9GAMM
MNISMKDHPPLIPCASARTIRVAVLEDDEAFRRDILLPVLHDHGFSAHGMASAAELYRNMLSQQFDIVLLDISLSDEDGLTVTQHLRATLDIGIIMLSGLVHRDHHIQALKRGADFYLSKPIDVDVLVASLHSLARRLVLPTPHDIATHHQPSPSCWRLDAGGWRFVSPHGKVVALTSSERCVLTVLIAAGDHPVSREALAEALSQNAYDSDPHRLEMIIYRLRRKVLAQTEHALPLITVRSKGYMLLCDS